MKKMKVSKRIIAILIVFCFFISFIVPLVDFTRLDFRIGNPKISTNYLYKDKVYNLTLNDIYDSEDPYKIYTDAYFQSQYFNSSYEWQQVHNETIDSGVDNNEVKYGNPSNIAMIKGTTGSQNNMLTLNAIYTTFTSTSFSGTAYESPVQFTDFGFTKGSGGASGELLINNGNYARIDSGQTVVSETLFGYIVPDSDILTNWNEGGVPPHCDLIDEAPGDMDGDGGIIVESTNAIHDKWDFSTLTIPAGCSVVKLEIRYYCYRDTYGGITVLTPYGSIDTILTMGSWVWFTYIQSGLSLNQADLNAFWIDVCRYGTSSSPIRLEAIYVNVYISGTYYSCDYEITWDTPSALLLNTFYYDYRTTVAVDCDLDIYNWDTTGWLELKSNTLNTYITGSYGLTDPYISGSNQVKIRFQTDSYGSDFDMELDQIVYSYYTVPPQLEFTILTPFDHYNYDLLSIHVESHQKTSISQQIYFKIWNYDTSSYDTISSSTETTTITKREFNSAIPNKYISSSGVKLYWNGINSEDDFIFSIDYLFIRICYKMNIWHEVNFDTLGLWRYRWEIHGSLQYTDWTQFEVVNPIPNFHAISESDVSTRWIIQEATLSPVEDFHDDITVTTWLLKDAGDSIIETNAVLSDDAYVDQDDPNTNHGNFPEFYIDYLFAGANLWSYIKYVYPSYLDLNITSNSSLYISCNDDNSEAYVYNTTDFSEATITWNNKPALDKYQKYLVMSAGYGLYNIGYPSYCYALVSKDGEPNFDAIIMSSESTSKPYIRHHFSKVYQGSGFMYMQTDETESIALLSEDYGSHYNLESGDYFEVDFQTSSDSEISLILYKNGVVQKTLTMSPNMNTNFNRHTVQLSVSESLEFDQLKISSTFEDKDNVKVYDIKTFIYAISGDHKDFYVSPNGWRDVYLTPEYYNLRIYEYGDPEVKLNENITIESIDIYKIYTPTEKQLCRLTLYSKLEPTMPLIFENYRINITRSLNGHYGQIDLIEPVFYADVGTTIDFDVHDRFNNLINSIDNKLADSYIALDLDVYQLEIINLMLQKTTVDINNSHIYELASRRWIDFMLAENDYQIGYYDPNNIYQQFLIHLDSNQVVELNMSRICNLYYTNQKGEYLEFHQFKTYINGTLLLQNVFYATDGEHKGIEIKDRYDISIKNETYVEGTEPYNQISIILTQYSLKVMSQQLCFNHINITRDPNYYYSPYYWSEWIAPSEIIKFNLFAGYYRINLTNNEAGSSMCYNYTFNGDDILLITSSNTIYNVLVNLANVNATIGNQITMVEINITNQNSQINNSIIMIDVNLGSINSTLGTMLLNLDVDITNIANNISALYVFTSNSFINLGNDINLSFINIENNIISINQSISNLIVGISNEIYLINGTISSMITQMENNLLLMNVSINTALFDLGTTLNLIGSNITNNFILLNNSIYLNSLNINDSRIAIINNLALINNSISNLIAQVYSSVYLINNSIYTAVVDLGTYLSLMNNTIYGNMSIVLQMNEFLSEILRMTMFSELLNWTNIGLNTSLLTSQIDVWTFINHYINQSIEVHLRYQDLIEKLVITDFRDQWLPNKDVEYNLWSEKDQKYLDEWKELDPNNKTVDFGFYNEKVTDIPSFDNTSITIVLIILIFIGVISLTSYSVYKYNKRVQNLKVANAQQHTIDKDLIEGVSRSRSSRMKRIK